MAFDDTPAGEIRRIPFSDTFPAFDVPDFDVAHHVGSGKMTAVTNLYTERLLPVCSSLRSSKYRSVSVERDDEDVYHLREEVYTPASVEYPLNAGAGKVLSNKQKRGKH